MKKPMLLLTLLVGSIQVAQAQTTTFASPNGLSEECRILPHIPGGHYSKKDAEKEAEFCTLDFYNTTGIALCPKTWSTSPGTMVYDISKSGLGQRDYEAQASCGGDPKGHVDFGKFKQTMNQKGTSGTFSPSSMMYYHLSRYFDTTVTVPVAVYRSMDKDAHFARVSQKANSRNMGKSGQNRAGWQWMAAAEQKPETYRPTDELFTADRKQIYGTMVGGGGTRYGTEINGIRSAWGVPQNNDFQNTPAFLALRSASPVNQAIKEGVIGGRKNSKINHDLGADVSDLQVALWMKELSEIVVLDYMFSQQDRVGNIDFKWAQYTVDATGNVKSDKIDSKEMRSTMKIGENMIQKTQLNDNDAGGRLYANFTKKTEMLQKLRHMNPDFYRKLMALSNDFQNQGELYKYMAANFGLDANQLKQLVTLTGEAAGILKATCQGGQMRFDLFDAEEILTNKAVEQKLNCENP